MRLRISQLRATGYHRYATRFFLLPARETRFLDAPKGRKKTGFFASSSATCLDNPPPNLYPNIILVDGDKMQDPEQMNTKAMLACVRDYLSQHQADSVQGYNAWRQNGAARFEHTLRVLALAQRIARAEGADLQIVRVAAIFHDVAKFDVPNKEHAVKSAEIAREFLARIRATQEFASRVYTTIARHNQIDATGFALEDCVLRDADLLDETGALGIVWSCINAGQIPVPTYKDAHESIVQHDQLGAEWVKQQMLTRTGRQIAEQRQTFVAGFLQELDQELKDGSQI